MVVANDSKSLYIFIEFPIYCSCTKTTVTALEDFHG